MSFETFKASVYSLLDEIAGQPEDLHVLQERLRETLSQMQAMGQPMPEDLVELEHWLEEELQRPRSQRPAPLPERVREKLRRPHEPPEPGVDKE